MRNAKKTEASVKKVTIIDQENRFLSRSIIPISINREKAERQAKENNQVSESGENNSKMNFSVSPDKEESLKIKMDSLGIKEIELEEKYIRSSKKGGQKVNKTSTCVYLKHEPTGIEVKCQEERSLALNRFLARRILVDKIESLVLGRKRKAEKEIEKIRRQKRKRSKRAKEKILRYKKIHSEKKNLRKAPAIE